MPSIEPRTLLRCGVYVAIGLLIALGVRACPDAAQSDPARDLLSADLARRLHANTLALDSARVALRSARDGVTTTVTRYRTLRDTLNIHDTAQVIVFRDRADSVVRSCTELAESCERFRVRADSSLASLRLDRDRWKLATESLQPSGLRKVWDRVKVPLAFGVGLYVGARAVR